MQQMPVAAMVGCFLLGFILCAVAYPRILNWAGKVVPDFRRGQCFHCGMTAYVTACGRCGKGVAYCHYYSVLGTDVPDRQNLFRKRRSVQVCTKCLTPEEAIGLETLLKGEAHQSGIK
jgi:hypothetical protein